MSVIVTSTVEKIYQGRYIHHTALAVGDATGGVLEAIIRFPRAAGKIVRAQMSCRITGAVNFGIPRLFIEKDLTTTWEEVVWSTIVLDGSGSAELMHHDDLPLWAFDSPLQPQGFTGVYVLLVNNVLAGMTVTLHAECELPDITLKDRQRGKWTTQNFFMRLDKAIFGEPQGFSTP